MAQQVARLRYSVSLVRQGKHQFYTLTMPSDVLARTCVVSTRKEDSRQGFQRELDKKRAAEIAEYIEKGMGTIPNSIVLSAQPAAQLRVIGRSKTLEFSDAQGAFLILDGQHRVYGFSLTRKVLRVPVVIYNGLTRAEESRLFIDINTKQRPVPPQLLLDIKRLAEIETDSEIILREIFDLFDSSQGSALTGKMAPFESTKNHITRVTFNSSVKPLLELLTGKSPQEMYKIINNYLLSISHNISKRTDDHVLSKPVVFRAFMGLFPAVAQRVKDKFDGEYTPTNFNTFLEPIFTHFPMKRLEKPGTSWVDLSDYLEKRLKSKQQL